jgi:hypothetical protein
MARKENCSDSTPEQKLIVTDLYCGNICAELMNSVHFPDTAEIMRGYPISTLLTAHPGQ